MPARTKFLNNKAFTLIELLIVIAIIAILTALIAFSYTTLQRNARDAQRKSDLQTVAGALQRFYSDNSYYPTDGGSNSGYMGVKTTTCGGPWNPDNVSRWGIGAVTTPFVNGLQCNGKNYIKSLPNDPTGAQQYCYASSATLQNYFLYAQMEGAGNLTTPLPCGNPSKTYNYQVTPND